MLKQRRIQRDLTTEFELLRSCEGLAMHTGMRASLGDKAGYADFCSSTYVPIYSQPWWMDAVCGPDNWGVWLYENGGSVTAAMPFYLERRERGLYITKAPLTQNNGIVFRHPDGAGAVARSKFEDKVISAADEFISGMGLAVYEQQYQTSFANWLPFSWRGYEALPRYTYVVRDTSDLDAVWSAMSAKQRSCVRKGERSVASIAELPVEEFYEHHERVFARQGLACPFSFELFCDLEAACRRRSRCRALAALNDDGDVASLIFLVWDGRRMYHLLGGSMPGLERLDTYAALIWRAIRLAGEMGLAYDFEGSMIERISKSFREFGGEPQQYFRIRKVFSPDVVRDEAEVRIARLG